MLYDDLGQAAQTLVDGRARILGAGLTGLERQYGHWPAQNLAEELAVAPRGHKPALGLFLARATLEDATAAPSRERFGRFLFRFGAHLKTSVSAPGLSSSHRLALAIATEVLFYALPTSSPAQKSEASAIRNRLKQVDIAEKDWRDALGIPEAEFAAITSLFETELGDGRSAPATERRRLAAPSEGPNATDRTVLEPLPNWLDLQSQNSPDPLVCATANWLVDDIEPTSEPSLAVAWTAFKHGQYTDARNALAAILKNLDATWGPTSSADSIRAWNWLRLVCELAAIENGEVSDVRRSWTSVCEFAERCLPEDVLLDDWLKNAIGDFVASDMASIRAWSAYTSRLVAVMGHENALATYSNQDKADLRAAWADQLALDVDDLRSTASASSSITSRLKQITQKLYLGARQQKAPAKTLREASHELPRFLDEAEGAIFEACLELSNDAERMCSMETTNHRDLAELMDDIAAMAHRLSVAGSSIMQDFVAPLVDIMKSLAQAAMVRLGDISRPEVSVQLASSKLPFSAAEGSRYEIVLRAANAGNATAETISFHLTAESIGIDCRAVLASLGPGSQSEVVLEAVASGVTQKAVALACEIQWTDALLQQFGSTQALAAEDQMPVSWSDRDVNPFSLGTISEPERLVGRDDDLNSLDALLAGGASAYVTGHKRVGKTSLIRVLLRSVKESRGWAGSLLPLGRALGQDQTAGDLVYALLDEVLDACSGSYGHHVSEIDEVVPDPGGNFARAANKWLRTISRALPADARVVIAIDDFDELPSHLIDGPQADSLFLFMRSLVDERWLNLIVVGSEILPTIIQAQAHKLNQVVPVSVTNFSSRAATAELLETPTSDRLEWLSDAVDRVHYLCAGNPYYETLLAQRLWQTMRERSRSVVTAGDVNEALDSVSRGASESHFIHLWADSAGGLDHTARSAIVASAVMRSIARCGGPDSLPAAPEEVTRVAQGWIQTATTEELTLAIATLKAREVVRTGPSADRLLVSIPLVGEWLLGAGGRALDGVYATSKHATATVRMITDSDLVGLSRGLRYRGEQVTEIRIKAWLEQFGPNDRQYLAFKMLRRMIMDGYFTPTRLQTTEMPRLLTAIGKLDAARALQREANNQNLKNAFLIDHGVAGDSTQGTLSALAKSLKIKKANIIEAAKLADKIKSGNSPVVLFLLDDYCGTGTHLKKELDKLSEVVVSLGEDVVDRVTVVVGACVVSDRADLPAPNGDLTVETVGATFLGDRFRPFSAESGVFDSAKERQDAEEMVRSIGSALLPNNPLGFGSRALLTLFEFNCPNNVAPIFWRSGAVSGSSWTPLFERAT